MNFNFFKSVASRMCLATMIALMATTMISCNKKATDDAVAFTVEFREDGAFEGTGYLGNGDGMYITTSTTITVYKDGAVYAYYTIKELTYTDAYVIVVMNPAIFHFRLRRMLVYIEPWI